MKFKTFLETIDVPPHQPKEFYDEHKKAFEYIAELIKKLEVIGPDFCKFAKEIASRNNLHYIEQIVIDLPGMLKGEVDRLIDALKYLPSMEGDTLLKWLDYSLSSRILSGLEWVDFEDVKHSLQNLEEEISGAKDYWDDSYGDYRQRLEEVEFVKKSWGTFRRMKEWYNVYYTKTKALKNSGDRRLMTFMSGKNPDRSTPITQQIETLYHATTAVNSILRDGFKSRDELGGKSALGGGPSNVISYTSDIKIAEAIVWALRRAVEIATGRMNYKQLELLAKKLGNHEQAFQYMQQAWGKFEDAAIKRDWLFRSFQSVLAHQSKIYNPWFSFVTYKDFEKVDPKEIGIIASEVDMTQVSEYLSSMEEYRVPTAAIKKSWKVPYGGALKPQVRY